MLHGPIFELETPQSHKKLEQLVGDQGPTFSIIARGRTSSNSAITRRTYLMRDSHSNRERRYKRIHFHYLAHYTDGKWALS